MLNYDETLNIEIRLEENIYNWEKALEDNTSKLKLGIIMGKTFTLIEILEYYGEGNVSKFKEKVNKLNTETLIKFV